MAIVTMQKKRDSPLPSSARGRLFSKAADPFCDHGIQASKR